MKKNIILTSIVLTLLCCMNINASAKNDTASVVIPDYQVIIDDSSIYYADSIYPFLNYKGITYLPMTYEYSRAMNLTTGYLQGTAFMVAYQPGYGELPIYETTANKKYNTAIVPSGYNIYVNAKKVDNKTAEYPLLNFRDVTYFPLTWEYAVEEFGWEISFENNIFRIDTDNNTAYRWTLKEKRENDAILELYYDREIPLDDVSVKHEYIIEYYSLDYDSGELIQINNYQEEFTDAPKSEQLELTVDDGYVYYNGQRLDGVYIEQAANAYLSSVGEAQTGYTISAYISEIYQPLEVVDVGVNTYYYGIDGTRLGKINYTFIRINDTLKLVGAFKTVENVYELNGDIYFNTVGYAQTIFRHYRQNRKLWKLSKDGELSEIRYGDYNSMVIIGKANNKLYLKCMWAPENNMEDSPFSVSLVNDGYYTFDTEGIRFVSPYIYSDYDIVSDNGDIFAVDNKTDKITKCEINPEYY